MRIAVCISGQARNVPVCAETLKQGLLGGSECDFFVHTWSESDVHAPVTYQEFVAHKSLWKRFWKRNRLQQKYADQMEYADALNQSFPRGERDLRSQLEAAYQPIRLSIEPQAVFDVSRFQNDENGVEVAVETNIRNMLSMYTSIYRAGLLKSQYEKEQGFTYDCVVRCRSDLFFFGECSLADYTDRLDALVHIPRGGDHRAGINDQLAFSSSQNMDTYFETVDYIDTHLAEGGVLHPESLLASHLARKGLVVERPRIDYEIVRGQFGSADEFLEVRAKAKSTGGAHDPSYRNEGSAGVLDAKTPIRKTD